MLREALGRRGLFKRLGVGALLAASGQENIAKAARLSVGTGKLLGPMPDPVSPKTLRLFRQASDFSSWWKEYGKHNTLPRQVNSIDPDIAGFRLPLATKVRMQRERNYFFRKAEAKQGFLFRLLRDGEYRIYDYGGGGSADYPATAESGSSRNAASIG